MFSSAGRRGFEVTVGGGGGELGWERALMVVVVEEKRKWGLVGGFGRVGVWGLREIRWGWKMEEAAIVERESE